VATDDRACPACGSGGPHRRHHAPGKEAIGGGPLELLTCASCGAQFQPRVPTEAELGRWYDYMGHIAVNSQTSPLLDRRLARLVAVFDEVRQTGRLLEIGCGGGLLVRAASARGWEVWGTEISPSCASLLRPVMGDRIFHGTVVEAPFPSESFDGAAMIEVIEHLVDPLPYLLSIRRLLRPGGRLFLTTPNVAGASARVLGTRARAYMSEHLTYFDPRSMTSLLTRAGFDSVEVSTTNADLVTYAWQMRPRLFRRPAPPPVPRSTTAEARTPIAVTVAPAPTRASALKATLLDAAIETVNHVTDFVGLGDTLKIVARRLG
jgi:SAM-dependent methyltransferase